MVLLNGQKIRQSVIVVSFVFVFKDILCYIWGTMKKEIHPEYHNDAVITCSCGNNFTTGSTQKEMKVEVCSECHPFYTGTEKVMDTAGRVEKFKARTQAAKEKQASKSQKASQNSDQKEEGQAENEEQQEPTEETSSNDA